MALLRALGINYTLVSKTKQGCRRTFFKCELKFFSSYNGDFVAFLMQWEPNGNLIGPVKLKNGDLWLLNCNIWRNWTLEVKK